MGYSIISKPFLAILLLAQSYFSVGQVPTWDDGKVDRITQMCETNLTETFLIYQGGELKFRYGDESQKYKIFSIRKSLVSLLYGIYAAEGKVQLGATLADLNIDDVDGLTDGEKQATVMQLLQARSGVYHNAAFETPGMVKKRPARGSHPRGTFWYYNNWDFNALNTILEQETGLSVFEAFQKKIADPLDLQDFSLGDHEYVFEEGRSVHKATLWRLSGRDLMSIGVTLLNGGKVGGKEIVPEEWIKKSATEYSDLGMFGAYGLCWWLAKNGQHYPFVHFPDGTFTARGTAMQDLIIVPEYDMVLVHQTNPSGPDDVMMKVTTLGRMLKAVMDQ